MSAVTRSKAAQTLASLPQLLPPKGHNKPLRDEHAEREAFVVALTLVPQFFTTAEREAVTSVFFEGRSVSRAAAHLGANENTVQHRIKAARATLRLWLRREATP